MLILIDIQTDLIYKNPKASSLRNTALETIRSLEISEGNYAIALDFYKKGNHSLVSTHCTW